MYFPGDPLLRIDPIFQSVPAAARERLVAQFDLALTQADFALGYRFDIVVGGREATPEDPDG
jgi:protocatechuate 3,4-dioxygenase beta subunit